MNSIQIIQIAQIIIAALLTICILLQQRGTALGSGFGGEGESFYSTRRGIQNKIYWATIILGALFIIISVANLII
jgi:protein translocase SecG subunit